MPQPSKEEIGATLAPRCKEECAFCIDGEHSRCKSRRCKCEIRRVYVDLPKKRKNPRPSS